MEAVSKMSSYFACYMLLVTPWVNGGILKSSPPSAYMRWPSTLPTNTINDEGTSHVQYFPTSLEGGLMDTRNGSVILTNGGRPNAGDTYRCTETGIFPKPGSCRFFYQCEENGQSPGVYAVHLHSCPAGTIFNKTKRSCDFASEELTKEECMRRQPLAFDAIGKYLTRIKPKRVKRVAAATVFAGILAASSVISTANQLFQNGRSKSGSGGVGVSMPDIENKLSGIEAKLTNVGLLALENKMDNEMYSKMTHDLIRSDIEGNRLDFAVTRKLINRGFLEDRINTAELKEMIIHGNANTAANFAKVHVSLSEIKEFIKEEIAETRAILREGFESVPDMIDQSKLQTLVSKLLIIVKGFNNKVDHLESLPEQNRKDEIERSHGFLNYIESSELQNVLNEVVQQKYAIPSTEFDLSAVFTLDLLVHGLQVHTNMLSSVVSSYAYLASKALEELQLESFNTYMQRLRSSVENVKISLGYAEREGILTEIKKVLFEVQRLPYVSEIRSFSELLFEKFSDIENLENDLEHLVISNKELPNPGGIKGKPIFSPFPSVPIGKWVTGKKVMYAIQLVSDHGLSSVGEWSTPYTIDNKACPTITLPKAETGVIRFIYRKFDDENPELVAIERNNEITSIRDMSRDILNAAANPNEDVAIKEIMELTNDFDLDINLSLEDQVTPLHYAAKHGNTKVMDVLINKKANVHAKANDNQQPIHFAALFGAKEGIEYLIEKGAEVNAQTRLLGLSPLHIAVANDHVEATQLLIEKDAFINIKDNNGLTPLHMAVSGDGGAIDIMLQNDKIDVNAVTIHGFTPLHYASRGSSTAVVQKLLRVDAIDVNAKSNALLSPIHLAAMSGNVEIITELIRKGASASAGDTYGSTSLHYAAFSGNKQAILTLIELEPSLKDIKNAAGETALTMAEENKEQDVINIFIGDKKTVTEIFKREFLGDVTIAPPTISPESQLTETCSSDKIANQLITSMEKTCENVAYIDSYVNLVRSMIPLGAYYKNHAEYSEIFKSYDQDIRKAKEHVWIWRNGDSIVKGISDTFDLAKDFELKFQKKYEINRRIVQELEKVKNQSTEIEKLEADIAKAETKIANLEKTVKLAVVPEIKKFFEDEIQSYRNDIAEKRKMINEDFTLIQKLREIKSFLTFVKKDSEQIQERAKHTKKKIEIFRDNIVNDKSVFERHGTVAADAHKRLEDETTKNKEELEQIRNKIKALDEQINQERIDIRERYKSIHDSQDELRKIREDLRERMKDTKIMKIVGAIFSPFVIGIPLLIYASVEEGNLINSLQSSVEENMLQVNTIQREIETRHTEIGNLRNQIAERSSASSDIRDELSTFIGLDSDLKTLVSTVDRLLEAIEKAIHGATELKNIFDDVTTKLDIMINEASNAKTEAERRNVDHFIYNELNILLCNWNDVYQKVSNLKQCVNGFRFIMPENQMLLSLQQ